MSRGPDEQEPDESPVPGEPTVDESNLEPTRTLGLGFDSGSLAEDLPAEIGGYRILRKLGEGGMGLVYEAEQPRPRRHVALKVIRGGGWVDAARLKMFERETSTLARLRHPNIAAIYEAGRTEDGQHFFAMEFVRGSTLHEFIQRRPKLLNRVELELRLAIFCKLCRAVNYAHQRGVIHRDLKPANIIVVEDDGAGPAPEVKVLDFGLARMTDTDVAAASMATEVGVIKGTLSYMSPEQARGDPGEIDIRSDVYALGVILFEVLTHAHPLQMETRSLVEAVRRICEEAPKSLRESWPGPGRPDEDLDTIVCKALEKEADRRYSGAGILAGDIERYLTSQPILARPPSNAYLLKKFARRNRVLVGGALATLVALAGGIVVSTVFGLREARQRRDLEAVVAFQSGMVRGVDPEQAGLRIIDSLRQGVGIRQRQAAMSAEDIQVRLQLLDDAVRDVNPTDLARAVLDQNILAPAAEAVAANFKQQPRIEGRLRLSIGNTYQDLGLYDRALPHLERALALHRQEFGATHPATLLAKEMLAELHWDSTDYVTAAQMFRELLDERLRRLGAEHPETLRTKTSLAGIEWAQGRSDQAESLYVETLGTQRRVLGQDHLDTARTQHNLGVIYFRQGRFDEAELLWAAALKTRKESELLGPEDEHTLETQSFLAALCKSNQEFDRAERLYLEVLAAQRRTLGDDHPRTLKTYGGLALVYNEMGRQDEAIRLHRETLAARRRVHGDRHPFTLRSTANLAVALTGTGQYEEAERLLRQLIELDEQVQPGTKDHAVHVHSLGELQIAIGELAAAERTLLQAVEMYERLEHRYAGLALYQLGVIAAREARREDALSYLRRALERGHTQGLSAEAAEFASLQGDAEYEALVAEARAADEAR